jgi:hypothetical protein
MMTLIADSMIQPEPAAKDAVWITQRAGSACTLVASPSGRVARLSPRTAAGSAMEPRRREASGLPIVSETTVRVEP